MTNIRQNPRLDDEKSPEIPEVIQEPQGASDETSDDEKITQVREPPQEEETKREYDVKEEQNNEIDYQCVGWGDTFQAASIRVATAFK